MMGVIKSRGSEQINVRVPDGMRDALRVLAARNRRSVNSEIVSILEKELETKKADASA
ncbi:MAG: Arc family DNA-binding protein [Rhizobium oryzihabitans]